MSTFFKHPEGETITPYEIPVHIPPTGYVWDYFKGDWATRPIYSRSEEKEHQHWERPIKIDYDSKRAVEKRKQKANPLYIDPELEAFREQEWDRRINGFWFYNNGVPTYITGLHYFYLTWWRIDIGYPSYRQSDRDFFYMWSYCEGDPKCFGLIEAARRRSGKALPLDTEIPTPDGFKKMIDLKVGDFVFGAEGEPVKITYKSPIHYDHKVYRVNFSDGSSLDCDEYHQWEVSSNSLNIKRSVLNTIDIIKLSEVNDFYIEICRNIDYKYSDEILISGKRKITSMEEIESVPTQCISVDSERAVYLAGRDYILTHNTYRAGVILFEAVSRMQEANAGIQSKTAPDAQKVFSKLINSFRALPDFFQPVYDTTGGTRPKKVLSFIERSRKALEDDEMPTQELLGKIDFESSGLLSYDSQKLKRYLRDEYAKVSDIDVAVGWAVVRECLRLGVSQIVGKALYTSTIEESGSIPARRMWEGADFNRKDEKTNMTENGLYRTFTPAYKNVDDHIDIYGICDETTAKQEMIDVRASMSNPKLRAEYIRKYPFDINEAFFSINDECIFDSLKINEQVKILSFKEEDHWYIRGNLQWVDGIGSDVQFIPNNNGRWKIHAKWLEYNEKVGLSNKWISQGDQFKPQSENTGITGADTFDHSKKNLSDEKQASNAAFYTFNRHDPLAPELDDTFICEYVYRQPTADLMAEDLIMQCVFFGTPAIIENNKPSAIHFFQRNGYKPFVVRVDKRDGVSGTPKNKQSMAEVTEIYIRDHCTNVVFPNLLLDWNQFSLENSTKFDSTMGAGWALLIATRIGKKFIEKPEHMKQAMRNTGFDYSRYL